MMLEKVRSQSEPKGDPKASLKGSSEKGRVLDRPGGGTQANWRVHFSTIFSKKRKNDNLSAYGKVPLRALG